MLSFLIRVYRANPFRPHCARALGEHAWTCIPGTAVRSWCDDLPGPIPD